MHYLLLFYLFIFLLSFITFKYLKEKGNSIHENNGRNDTTRKLQGHLSVALSLAAGAEITLALRNHYQVGLLLGV